MKGTFGTEIGMLGVWDSPSMAFVKSPDDGVKYMVDDASFADHMTKGLGVFWGTGGDGAFNVEVRVGINVSLSQEEQAMIEIKAENLKLIVTNDKTYVGSPEYVGYTEQEGVSRQQITRVPELTPGIYAIDVYFLYDAEATEKLDGMSFKEIQALPEGFDKSGYIVLAKPADSSHRFAARIELPTLG